MTGLGAGPAAAIDIHTFTAMGTVVSIQVAGGLDDRVERQRGIARSVEWFHEIERCCTRFDPESEVMRLARRIGEPVAVSDALFEAAQFAIAVAEDSGGAFDPTVGRRMETRGFNRNVGTGAIVDTPLADPSAVSYRDIVLDPEYRTIRLVRPLILDLGAVAKGLAIDLAARELKPFEHFAIDAGGDLYLAGLNPHGERWSVGIRHPRDPGRLLRSISVSALAVCTSGDYERVSAGDRPGHHILDPRTGDSTAGVTSVTVVAPTAMMADALGTAAFVLGPDEGVAFLERHGVDGLIVSDALDEHATPGMAAYS